MNLLEFILKTQNQTKTTHIDVVGLAARLSILHFAFALDKHKESLMLVPQNEIFDIVQVSDCAVDQHSCIWGTSPGVAVRGGVSLFQPLCSICPAPL